MCVCVEKKIKKKKNNNDNKRRPDGARDRGFNRLGASMVRRSRASELAAEDDATTCWLGTYAQQVRARIRRGPGPGIKKLRGVTWPEPTVGTRIIHYNIHRGGGQSIGYTKYEEKKCIHTYIHTHTHHECIYKYVLYRVIHVVGATSCADFLWETSMTFWETTTVYSF